MSYQAQTWVNEHAPYEGGSVRAVLKELAYSMNKDSEVAWPGVLTLACSSGYSRRTVIRALQTMLQDGVIQRANPGGGRGIKAGYRLVTDRARWTLSAATVNQASRLAEMREALESQRRNRAGVSPYRAGERVTRLHPLSEERVTSATVKGDNRRRIGGNVHYMNRIEPKEGTVEKKEGAEGSAEGRRQAAAAVKEIVARLAARSRAGV